MSLKEFGEVSLRREAVIVGYLLNSAGCGAQIPLDGINQLLLDDAFGRLQADACGNLRKIAAAHIQIIGIIGHITTLFEKFIDSSEEVAIQFVAPAMGMLAARKLQTDIVQRLALGLRQGVSLRQMKRNGGGKAIG